MEKNDASPVARNIMPGVSITKKNIFPFMSTDLHYEKKILESAHISSTTPIESNSLKKLFFSFSKDTVAKR